MDMEMIRVSEETKTFVRSFGAKEETYDSILKRMYSLAVQEQSRQFLMSSEHMMSIDEARKFINDV